MSKYHERLVETSETREASERSFGIVFFVLFQAIAAYLWWYSNNYAILFATVGLAFGALALFAPRTLAPLNWIWTRFGLLLHRVISPVIITALFVLVITPVGLLMRLFGQRPLNLKFEPNASTYWIERTPPGPPTGSLDRQY